MQSTIRSNITLYGLNTNCRKLLYKYRLIKQIIREFNEIPAIEPQIKITFLVFNNIPNGHQTFLIRALGFATKLLALLNRITKMTIFPIL